MVHCKLDKHHKQVFSCDYGLSHRFGESFLSLVLLPAMLVPMTTDQSCAQCTKHGTVGKDVILWRWWWCWQWVGCCSVLCFTLGYQVDCAVALRVGYAIVADLATLLCAAFDRERAGDGTFINDTVNHTNLEGADDVYNLSRIPYLTEDLPQAPPPHRVKGLCQVHKHHVKIPVLLPALLLHQLQREIHVWYVKPYCRWCVEWDGWRLLEHGSSLTVMRCLCGCRSRADFPCVFTGVQSWYPCTPELHHLIFPDGNERTAVWEVWQECYSHTCSSLGGFHLLQLPLRKLRVGIIWYYQLLYLFRISSKCSTYLRGYDLVPDRRLTIFSCMSMIILWTAIWTPFLVGWLLDFV